MKKEDTNVSLFSQSEFLLNDEGIEEIFALNLGDFISEHLISGDLAQKIGQNASKDKRIGLKNQLRELVSIYSLNNTLCVLNFNKKEERAIYTSIAQSITQMLDIEGCYVYLSKDSELAKVGSCGELSENSTIQEAFLSQETIVSDITAVPMFCNVKSVGVIAISSNKIQKEYLSLVESIAALFATSMTLQATIDETNKLMEDEEAMLGDLQHIRAELTALIGDLCNYQQDFVEHLALAVDAKGQYKVAHSRNTANLAKEICKELGLNEKTTDLIYYAGLLQNIGKITLPEKIFSTNGKLSSEELKKIQEHSNMGVHLLMSINFLSEVVPYITYQQERFDGSGRPEGLKGNSIPFGSRIIAVADVFSAMTSDRPHRKAMGVTEALEMVKNETGTKWDSAVVEALYKVVS